VNSGILLAILLVAGLLAWLATPPEPVVVERVVVQTVPVEVKPKPVKRIAPDPWRGLRAPGYALP
jgi:hypothetical protein